MAGAIRETCGKRVQVECDEYLRRRASGKMLVSECMHTHSWSLAERSKCKYVVHACGPNWRDYDANEKAKCYEDLRDTFYNIFIYVENTFGGGTRTSSNSNMCNDDDDDDVVDSIAVPLISSGIFGVPRAMCCEALWDALCAYVNASDDRLRTVRTIALVNLDTETNEDLIAHFQHKLDKHHRQQRQSSQPIQD